MKSNRFLMLFLLAAVVFLSGVTIYQNRIIAKQSSEMRYLLEHCTFRVK